MQKLYLSVLVAGLALSGSCPDSDKHCLSCVSDSCAVCAASFATSNGECEAVTKPLDGCVTYHSEGVCKACIPGYFLASRRTCQKIAIPNCLELRSFSACHVCAKRILAENGICNGTRTCSDKNCEQCAIQFGQEVCVKCRAKFTLTVKDSLSTCVKSVDDTKNCMVANRLKPDTCAVCNVNYYYSKGKCKKSDKYFLKMAAKTFATMAAIFALFTL